MKEAVRQSGSAGVEGRKPQSEGDLEGLEGWI